MSRGLSDGAGSRHVVVIGGGLAGITAALACADAGARVTLFEARRTLGGAATSLSRDGLEVDAGQHVFLRCCGTYRSLLRRLGVTHLTQIQERLDIAVLAGDGRRGQLRRGSLPAPLHLAPALARYPFLNMRERGSAALAALALRRLDPRDPLLDEQTFGDWLAKHGQSPNAVDSLWDLIGTPTLNLRAAEAGLGPAVRVFRTGLLEHPAAADVGIASVPLARLHAEPAMAALARADVRVVLGTAARRVVQAARDATGPAGTPGRGDASPAAAGNAAESLRAVQSPPATRRAPAARSGRLLTVTARDGELTADAVIVAVPHDRVAGLLPPGAVDDPSVFASLGQSAIVSAHVVYDRRVLTSPFAAALDPRVQWVFDRTRAAGLSRGQYLIVTVSGADHLLDQPEEMVLDQVLEALAGLLPEARTAGVERSFLTRVKRATFRQAPGSGQLRPGLRTRMPGLYLAGAYTDTGWPATMEGAVRSGLCAAAAAVAGDGAATAACAGSTSLARRGGASAGRPEALAGLAQVIAQEGW